MLGIIRKPLELIRTAAGNLVQKNPLGWLLLHFWVM